MKFEQIPVRGQKFEIGRTINPFECDCEKCDFLHCPKHNYAVKMTRKIPSFEEFWEYWKDEIIKLNSVSRLMFNFKNQYKLKLNYGIINEMMNCIKFPKGLYWANSYDTRIDLIKISRNGNEITLGNIYIDKGNIWDSDLSTTQYKVAEKISNFLKNITEHIFEHFEAVYSDSLVGWLTTEGRHYICKHTEHSKLSHMLDSSEIALENRGWIKIISTNDDFGWLGNRNPTAEQRNWLSVHGYSVD